jgi:hypothetical protein
MQEQLGAKQEPAVEPDSDEESEEEEPAAAPKFNPFDLLSDDEVQICGWYCSMAVVCCAPHPSNTAALQDSSNRPNRRCACVVRLAVALQQRQSMVQGTLPACMLMLAGPSSCF